MLRTLQLRISFLEKELEELSRKISAAPAGKLRIYASGGYTRWYVSLPDGKRIYLPKTQTAIANALWQKNRDLEKQKRYLKELRECRRMESVLEKLYAIEERNTCRQMNTTVANEIAELSDDSWENESYIHNPYPFDGKGEKGPRGVRMRSKSEVIIAMTLESFHILYRYECAYFLGGRNVFPDFMIKRPSDGKIILWEHFGMWDIEEYRDNAVRKINEYQSAGLVPFDDFIYSIETGENHVDMDRIANMIRTFILF